MEKNQVGISDPKRLIKTYEDSKTGSGLTTPRSFCSNCGRCERLSFWLIDLLTFYLVLSSPFPPMTRISMSFHSGSFQGYLSRSLSYLLLTNMTGRRSWAVLNATGLWRAAVCLKSNSDFCGNAMAHSQSFLKRSSFQHRGSLSRKPAFQDPQIALTHLT